MASGVVGSRNKITKNFNEVVSVKKIPIVLKSVAIVFLSQLAAFLPLAIYLLGRFCWLTVKVVASVFVGMFLADIFVMSMAWITYN